MIKKMTAAAAIAAALAMTSQSPAFAADLPAAMPVKAPPVALWNPWMIRLRALVVDPRDDTSIDQLPGTGAHWSTSVVPELDITYFFTPNIAAELILGVTRHKATGEGIVNSGAFTGLNINGLPIGRTWLLPPTLTLQYHFTNFGAFKPYIGAGVNYTVFFSEKAANVPGPNAPGVAITSLKVHNTFAPALQAGFDYMLDQHWGLNVDVKKIFLRPDFDATVNGTIPLTGKAKLDPWLIGGGVTYKF